MPKANISSHLGIPNAKVICNGKVVMTTGSTQSELHVDRLEWQHPLLYRTQEDLDNEGAVDRFFMRKVRHGQHLTVPPSQAEQDAAAPNDVAS